MGASPTTLTVPMRLAHRPRDWTPLGLWRQDQCCQWGLERDMILALLTNQSPDHYPLTPPLPPKARPLPFRQDNYCCKQFQLRPIEPPYAGAMYPSIVCSTDSIAEVWSLNTQLDSYIICRSAADTRVCGKWHEKTVHLVLL